MSLAKVLSPLRPFAPSPEVPSDGASMRTAVNFDCLAIGLIRPAESRKHP